VRVIVLLAAEFHQFWYFVFWKVME